MGCGKQGRLDCKFAVTFVQAVRRRSSGPHPIRRQSPSRVGRSSDALRRRLPQQALRYAHISGGGLIPCSEVGARLPPPLWGRIEEGGRAELRKFGVSSSPQRKVQRDPPPYPAPTRGAGTPIVGAVASAAKMCAYRSSKLGKGSARRSEMFEHSRPRPQGAAKRPRRTNPAHALMNNAPDASSSRFCAA